MSAPWPSNISLCTITVSTGKPPSLYSRVVFSTAFKSNAKRRSTSSAAKTGEQPSLPQNTAEQLRPLSGSDVLWALKRATAEKAKKMKKDVSFTPRAPKDGNGEDRTIDYSSVRPLIVKSEWRVRLEQLEKRLEQLIDA